MTRFRRYYTDPPRAVGNQDYLSHRFAESEISVVTLDPCATSIAIQFPKLLMGLKAVSTECREPMWVRGLPKAVHRIPNGLWEIDEEVILAEEPPNLILSNDLSDINDLLVDVYSRMTPFQSKVQSVMSQTPHDLLTAVIDVGQLIGEQTQALEIVASLENRKRLIEYKSQGLEVVPNVGYLASTSPWREGPTWFQEMIRTCGGNPVRVGTKAEFAFEKVDLLLIIPREWESLIDCQVREFPKVLKAFAEGMDFEVWFLNPAFFSYCTLLLFEALEPLYRVIVEGAGTQHWAMNFDDTKMTLQYGR